VGNVRTYVGTSNVENTTAFLAIFATPPNNPDESWIPLQASDRDIFYTIGSTNWPCLRARDGIFGRVDVSFIGNWELPGSGSPSQAEIQEHFSLPDPESGFYYFANRRERTIMSWNAGRWHDSGSFVGEYLKPNYKNLITGYDFDTRQKQDSVKVVATKTDIARIGYYKRNKLETLPDLTSIDWVEYEYQLEAGKAVTIDLMDCVFGTLYFFGQSSLEQLLINAVTPAGHHPVLNYLPQSIPSLMAEWELLRAAAPPPAGSTATPGAVYTIETITTTAGGTTLRSAVANNDVWKNSPQQLQDIGYSVNHPMFRADSPRSYQWHLSPQLDGSIGDLTMDSPRTIEIHAALNASKYSEKDPETDELVAVNLSVLIEKIAALLGHRPEPNNTHDIDKEKEQVRRLMSGDAAPKEQDYGGNYFGKKGMLMRRVPNVFDKAGAAQPGGVVAVHDIPQMLAEIMDGLNIALGVQQSGAIAIKTADQTLRYPNQLELLTDLLRTANSTYQLAQKGYITSLVGQLEGKEIIGGLGLPTVIRSTNVVLDNKLKQLPYVGINPQSSLARKIDTGTYNTGVVLGQLI
jgi:hypothetical protein